MADPKEKRAKQTIPIREPHKRTKAGIFDNLRQLPHPVEEFLGHVPGGPRDQDTEQADISPLNITGLTDLTGPSDNASPVDIEGSSEIKTLSKTESPSISTGLANITSPTKSTSLVDSTSLAELAAPVDFTSPTENRAKALQFTRPVDFESPVENGEASSRLSPADLAGLSFAGRPDFSLLNSLPDVAGWTPSFHQVTDYLSRQLPTGEQAIYEQLYRLTWGYERPRVVLGFPKLADRANVGESTARAAAKALEKKGLIRRHGVVFGLNHEQGVEWEVFPPPALVKYLKSREEKRQRGSKLKGPSKSEGPADSGPMKDNVLFSKEHTQTQTGVSAVSRFSLEECRRYAEHLKQTGQGITNPGGYATKIFRSGEADTTIEAFLNPPAPLDINQCPDCNGSNFIYIDQTNPDRGVRPCKHNSLKT
jgi:DNA-binding Lrp family transcriptional regulator